LGIPGLRALDRVGDRAGSGDLAVDAGDHLAAIERRQLAAERRLGARLHEVGADPAARPELDPALLAALAARRAGPADARVDGDRPDRLRVVAGLEPDRGGAHELERPRLLRELGRRGRLGVGLGGGRLGRRRRGPWRKRTVGPAARPFALSVVALAPAAGATEEDQR